MSHIRREEKPQAGPTEQKHPPQMLCRGYSRPCGEKRLTHLMLEAMPSQNLTCGG